MHDAVHVMHVFLVEILRRQHSDECFQGRGIAHRHLYGIEAAP